MKISKRQLRRIIKEELFAEQVNFPSDFDASLTYPHDYEMEIGAWDSIDQPGKRWAERHLPYRVRGNQYEQPLRFKKIEGNQADVKDSYIKVEFVPVTKYEKVASENWPTNTFDIPLKALKQVNNTGGDLGSNVDAMYADLYADYIAWADSNGHITPTASSVMATYFDEVSLSADQKALLADQAGLELRDVEYYQSS